MPTVLLGNVSVIETYATRHDEGVREAQAVVHAAGEAPPTPLEHHSHPELGQQITTVSPPADIPLEGQLVGVISAWAAHSNADPAWVEGDEPLASAVADHFGCPIGCPDNGDPDLHNHTTWKAG